MEEVCKHFGLLDVLGCVIAGVLPAVATARCACLAEAIPVQPGVIVEPVGFGDAEDHAIYLAGYLFIVNRAAAFGNINDQNFAHGTTVICNLPVIAMVNKAPPMITTDQAMACR